MLSIFTIHYSGPNTLTKAYYKLGNMNITVVLCNFQLDSLKESINS